MNKLASLFTVPLLLLATSALAATYHVDPAKGSDSGDGSAAKPWKSLEQVVKSGELKTLKGGDTLLLADGYHGAVSFTGDNASIITIAPEKDARPHLSRLTIPKGKNWDIKGLVISSSFGQPYKGDMVSFADSGDSSNITIEDCFIYTALDSSKWEVKDWMTANNGIMMGRHGTNLTLRNNYVLNTRFGIQLCAPDSLCEGNVISDFSGDAMCATRDNETAQYNIIKNCYVSAKDGDSNHDDGIQCFLFNKGTGLMNNVNLSHNIVIAHEDPNQKWMNELQGIDGFDGPLVNFNFSDNVVNVDAFHGVTIFDGQNCHVERNVCWNPSTDKERDWIMFGSKQKLSKDNVAKDNYAKTFKLKQPGTIQENNKPVTEKIYYEALNKSYKTITTKFGEKHFAADREKLPAKDLAPSN